MHHPEEQPGVFLCDVMRLEDNWRCTFVAHPLEEAGGWSEAIARKALLCWPLRGVDALRALNGHAASLGLLQGVLYAGVAVPALCEPPALALGLLLLFLLLLLPPVLLKDGKLVGLDQRLQCGVVEPWHRLKILQHWKHAQINSIYIYTHIYLYQLYLHLFCVLCDQTAKLYVNGARVYLLWDQTSEHSKK